MSEPGLRLDYAFMMTPHVNGGVDPSRLAGELSGRFEVAHEQVEARRRTGELGFLDLPYARDTAARVQELADGFGQWFHDVVVLGIGGSGLGAAPCRQ